MLKSEIDKQAKELNKYRKQKQQKCNYCNGTGNKYATNYGDPAMGYSAIGKCDSCKGTGKESLI